MQTTSEVPDNDHSARLAALEHHTIPGPGYNRNVTEPYRDAVRMAAAQRWWEAEWWLSMAEMRAGVIGFDEWQARCAVAS